MDKINRLKEANLSPYDIVSKSLKRYDNNLKNMLLELNSFRKIAVKTTKQVLQHEGLLAEYEK